LNFNIYNSVIIAGVIQGLIFSAVVLFSEKYKHKSIYFLTAIILIYSLSNLQFYLADIRFITYDELYDYFYIFWGNIIPALLYLYVVTYLNPLHKISVKDKLLFIPFTISFLITGAGYKLFRFFNTKTSFIDLLKRYLEGYEELFSIVFHIVIILVLLVKIKNYLKKQENFDSIQIKQQLNWLSVTLIVMLIISLLWGALVLLYMFHSEQISYYPLWIAMAVLIYWLGHIGIYKFGIVEQRKQIRKKRQHKKSKTIPGKTKHIIIERLKTYLVDEKRFLDTSLSLEKTAKNLGLSQGHLSKIINTELQMSFKDYLNSLRVAEAKAYLADSEFSNYTLVAIGLEAGFNSKSTFNASFKKITGETPSQYKQRHIN